MRKGFTVVELLIVIAIIAIISAISAGIYNGVQNRARDAAVQSDMESISGQLEGYRTRIDSSSPTIEFPRNTTTLETLEIKANKSMYDTTISYNFIYCVQTTGTNAYQEYKLIARSRSGTIFVMNQDGFQTHSLTASSLTSNTCTGLGMGLVSNGMSGAGSWQTWVRDNTA